MPDSLSEKTPSSGLHIKYKDVEVDMPRLIKEDTVTKDLQTITRGMLAPLRKWASNRLYHSECVTQTLAESISDIPEENRVMPGSNILLPALEGLDRVYDEDVLRDMFKKILHKAFDSTSTALILPSFSGIIQQLSTDDAVFLKGFSKDAPLPIANLRRVNDKGSFIVIFYNLCMKGYFDEPVSHERLQITIDSLNRLGLVDASYENYSSTFNYDTFKQTPIYLVYDVALSTTDLGSDGYNKLDIQKGRMTITPFGRQFCNAVVS